MALISYGGVEAAAFAASRHLSDESLKAWRIALSGYVAQSGRILDLGCGTGSWTRAFRSWWPAIDVVAVEPSAEMRALFPAAVAGSAEAIPLPDASVDAVWLSTVIHHLPDLAVAAREIRRVLKPGGSVLIRSVFAGRHEGISLFRWFPEAVAVVSRYPSVEDVAAAFGAAGLGVVSCEGVPQVTAPSLAAAVEGLRREAHTPLLLIGDSEYAAGIERMVAAAAVESGPVVDSLDLVVLR
ncbi:class I SAM-dependent methyltransferase [Actinoplanes sp. NPDC023714]|uniref:class I SAM-dependent methyltransferase n=1 Tax=Actinoplanes sp. NPDC023714 TaxID=3154322 RepID=UPI0033D17C7C